MKQNYFRFKEINVYGGSISTGFTVYHETTTDVLWLENRKTTAFTYIPDPETGLPLTYKRWVEKYNK